MHSVSHYYPVRGTTPQYLEYILGYSNKSRGTQILTLNTRVSFFQKGVCRPSLTLTRCAVWGRSLRLLATLRGHASWLSPGPPFLIHTEAAPPRSAIPGLPDLAAAGHAAGARAEVGVGTRWRRRAPDDTLSQIHSRFPDACLVSSRRAPPAAQGTLAA